MSIVRTAEDVITLIETVRKPGGKDPMVDRDENTIYEDKEQKRPLYKQPMDEKRVETVTSVLKSQADGLIRPELTSLFWKIYQWERLFSLTEEDDHQQEWHQACSILKNIYFIQLFKEYKEYKNKYDLEETPETKIKISETAWKNHKAILNQHTHPSAWGRWGRTDHYKLLKKHFEVAEANEALTPKKRTY